MATQTTNYGLTKPAVTDAYNIAAPNANMDLIDTELKLQADAIAGKVSSVAGKGLSTNDYTTDEKNKLSGIATGAQVNVIETVKVNSVTLTPTNKAVNVLVPVITSGTTAPAGGTDGDIYLRYA